MNIDPDVDGFAEVLDLGCLASLHDTAIGGLKRCADDVRVDLPVRSFVDVGGCDSTAAERLVVGKGNDPVAIDAENAFLDLAQEAREMLVPVVRVAPAVALSEWRCTGAGGKVGISWVKKSGLDHLTVCTSIIRLSR